MVLTLGQYGGLFKYIGDTNIVVTAKYKRPNARFPLRKLSSKSSLFVESFAHTDISDSNWDKKISESLKDTNKQLKEINRSIRHVAETESKQE
jgi:hypothetical protein